MANIVKRIHEIKTNFFFDGVFRIALESFLPLLFASLYNLEPFYWESYVDVYANVVSFIWILLFTVMAYMIIMVILG